MTEKAQIKIIGNNDLTVKVSKFHTNRNLTDKIQDPLPNIDFCAGLVGAPNSGKTNLLVSLLTKNKKKGINQSYKRVYTDVIFITPSIKNITNKDILELEHIYDKITPEVLDNVVEIAEGNHEEKKHTLVIFDDVSAQFKKAGIVDKIGQIFKNHRQFSLSIMTLSQKYTDLSTDMRGCIKLWFIFSLDDKCCKEALFDVCQLTRKQFDLMYAFIFNSTMASRYSFLLIDRTRSIKNKLRFFKNFMEIEPCAGGEVVVEDQLILGDDKVKELDEPDNTTGRKSRKRRT